MNLFIYIIIISLISILIFFINFLLILKNDYSEKTSTYECGFQPFGNSIINFDIKYYLIAILFLLFDLELLFLLPWISCFNNLDVLPFISIFIFLLLLLLGFYYEWKRGSLDWN